MTHHMTRRGFVCNSAGFLAAPALARGGCAAQAASLDQLRALVLRQNGAEVFAQAFDGPGLDRAANIKSVSKTLLALLTGITIRKGHLRGPDQRVLPLLGRAPVGDARDALTIGDLLSMRAGLQGTSGANYGGWIASADWVTDALGQPLVDRPGGRFIYSSGGWHVLGAALSQASGLTLLEMARDWLGAPLDIRFAPWVRDPQGRYLGGNEMAVTPRALARIGEAVIRAAQGDDSLFDPAWIRTSWEPRARSPFSGDAYGYGWFLTRVSGYRMAYGRGYGGQVLAVVPEIGLSIAITSDPTLPARSGGYFGDLRGLMAQIVAERA